MAPVDYKFRDLELEKVVLATAFQHRLIAERVFTSVSPEAFAYDDTRRLYKVCSVFWRKYFAVPQMSTLRRFLQQHSDRVDRKKRVAYETLFDELKHLKVSRSNFSFRLDQLLELQMRRELFETAQGVLSDFKQQEPAPKVLEHLMQRAFACHDQTGVDSVIRKPLSSEVPRERWLEYVDRRDHPERYKGIPYGFTELDEESGGIRAPHLGMIFGRTASGKCVQADTLILDHDGRLRTIQDVVSSRSAEVLGLSTDLKLQRLVPDDFIDSGIQAVWKLTTRSGRSIGITKNHPLLTPTGWKDLKNLRVGDLIACPRKLPVFGASTLSPKKVKVLAYLIAEGSCSQRTIAFTNRDGAIQQDFADAVSCFKDVRLNYHGKLNKSSHETVALVYKSGKPNPVREWLRGLNLLKKAVDKEIPEIVFTLPRKKLLAFLGVLWSCDGYVPLLPFFSSTGRLRLEYSCGSVKLAKQLQHLLLRLGILSIFKEQWITYRGKRTRKILTGRVYVLSDSERDFVRILGPYFIGKKKEALVNFGDFLERRRHVTNLDVIPYSVVRDIVHASVPKNKWGKPNLKGIRAVSFYPRYSGQRRMSRASVLQVAEAVRSSKLVALARSDIFWDRIVSIKHIGKRQTYDLTLNSTHNFVANDIVVHNSRTLFNIGCNASLAGYPVMYVTVEMEYEVLQFMWESRNAGIAMQDILNGQLTEKEEHQYKKVLKRLGQEKCPFYAVDIARGCSPGRIDHEYAVHTRLYGVPPALILVDYANLLSPDEPSRDRSERYDLVFRELKEVARARHVPILTAAQQNRQSLKARQVGTEHIGLSDMAGAHCDFILHVMLGYNPLEEAIAQSMRVIFLTYIKARYHKLKRAKLFVDWDTNYLGDWSTFEEENPDE